MKVGIVGVTGYTGEELIFLLSRHPECELVFITSESKSKTTLGELYPWISKYRNLEICSVQKSTEVKVDVVFFCLPPGESVKWAGIFLAKKRKVIDLGADFRFDDPSNFNLWYNLNHTKPDLLKESVYGLPEINRNKIKRAQIVGNPGCYPTSILLALAPLFKADVVSNEKIIIDSKSGISGAGKTPTKTSHFIEANENINAYLPGRNHRHVGEIEQELSKMSPKDIQVVFTPHLTPMSRGLFSTIYLNLKNKISKNELVEIVFDYYKDEPFIRVLKDTLPKTNMAVKSNLCFLGAEIIAELNCAVVFSAIDNLGKGASWQAVQNMNIMFGIEETTGLI
jgi:N-acetyl-gamma-glutamyl-phosphate reductase